MLRRRQERRGASASLSRREGVALRRELRAGEAPAAGRGRAQPSIASSFGRHRAMGPGLPWRGEGSRRVRLWDPTPLAPAPGWALRPLHPGVSAGEVCSPSPRRQPFLARGHRAPGGEHAEGTEPDPGAEGQAAGSASLLGRSRPAAGPAWPALQRGAHARPPEATAGATWCPQSQCRAEKPTSYSLPSRY